jgi:Ni,Fe-hydrogenase I cytochrome b subunit
MPALSSADGRPGIASDDAHRIIDSFAGQGATRPIYVWEVPVRVTHWIIVGCVIVLSVTGAYIADLFLIRPAGRS